MHLGFKYNICIGVVSIIYALVLSKNDEYDISAQILEISLPFDAHGNTGIGTYKLYKKWSTH
jgi:hypothetical protein